MFPDSFSLQGKVFAEWPLIHALQDHCHPAEPCGAQQHRGLHCTNFHRSTGAVLHLPGHGKKQPPRGHVLTRDPPFHLYQCVNVFLANSERRSWPFVIARYTAFFLTWESPGSPPCEMRVCQCSTLPLHRLCLVLSVDIPVKPCQSNSCLVALPGEVLQF